MARWLSGPLATHLAGRAFLPVDLYDFKIAGTTYRYTTHSANLTGVAPAAVETYTSGVLEAGGQRQAGGLIVDDLEVKVYHPGSTVGGVSWVTRGIRGDLDNAPFTRYEGFLDPATGTLVGAVVSFRGTVSLVDPTSTGMTLRISVPTKRFDSLFPTLVVQPSCVWEFGSAGCGYAGTMEFAATLAAGSTSTALIVQTLPGGTPGNVANGVHFQNGAAKVGGVWRFIAEVENAGAPPYVFNVAPAFAPGVVEGAIGSAGALTLRLGCGRTAGQCDSDAWGYKRLSSFLGAPLAPASTEAD